MIVQQLVIEFVLDLSPGVEGDRFTFNRMFHYPADSIGEPVDVPFRRKKAGMSVVHELWYTRMIGAYDRQPGGHSFHQCHWNPFDITIAGRNTRQNDHV